MTEQKNDFNKDYLEEKLQAIGEKLGDAYGQPLLEELILRMERTVAHFNEEMDMMITTLKSRTKNQHTLLASMRREDPHAEPAETSEFEKKLESGDAKDIKSSEESVEEKPKKKFSLFKRKKKK